MPKKKELKKKKTKRRNENKSDNLIKTLLMAGPYSKQSQELKLECRTCCHS